VPHPDFGEAVTAVVVPNGSCEITEEGIITALGTRLARFKQPKRVFIVDALPRNTMGKVQKTFCVTGTNTCSVERGRDPAHPGSTVFDLLRAQSTVEKGSTATVSPSATPVHSSSSRT
jgi:hypothetical protein